MKKTLLAVLAASAAFTSAAFAQTNDDYIRTFGMFMYNQSGLGELKFTPQELDIFVQGLKDAAAGKELPKNIQEIAPKMGEYLRSRADANMAAEAAKAEEAAKKFFAELFKNEKVKKTDSGLAYEIIEQGSEVIPTADSDVVVNYKGTLIDGTVFDSTDRHGAKPLPFNLSKTIPGFKEGLQKIGKGGKIKLYIPGNLAYGDNPMAGIPANSTLIFDIELVDVNPNGAPQAAPAASDAPEVDKK